MLRSFAAAVMSVKGLTVEAVALEAVGAAETVRLYAPAANAHTQARRLDP
jgi:hypothetical protein